jgi:predicted AAA+ superfamily ATPase
MYIGRSLEAEIRKSLAYFPVTAIIGPRQCGKSTLARHILEQVDNGVYLDLERPSDLAKLAEPELYLNTRKGKLICIDEIQRKPDLFPLIRSLVDEWRLPGSFLILGSASRDLLRQSSESLAGRIAYHTLTPFLWDEIRGRWPMSRYISAGAFPGSLLTDDPDISLVWRENFIMTFLERDLMQWSGASPGSVRRLWTMLAHANGQTANYSRLAASLGLNDKTVRNHIDLLAGTFMLMALPPYRSNTGKRMVKAPKIYLADSGITAALLGIGSYERLLGHPGFGSLWEQIVLLNIRGRFPGAAIAHYRSSSGAEIDFVVSAGASVCAVECKASLSPTLSRGNHAAIEDVAPMRTLIAAPVEEGWPVADGIEVVSLAGLTNALIA